MRRRPGSLPFSKPQRELSEARSAAGYRDTRARLISRMSAFLTLNRRIPALEQYRLCISRSARLWPWLVKTARARARSSILSPACSSRKPGAS